MNLMSLTLQKRIHVSGVLQPYCLFCCGYFATVIRMYLSECAMQNHYRTLDVHKHSTDEEVKKAYTILAGRYHPDRHNNDPVMAAKMTEVNVAYNVLKNVKSRKEYDKQLALFGGKCPSCQGVGGGWRQKGFVKKVLVPCTICAGTGVV